jgi:hypothetical protein
MSQQSYLTGTRRFKRYIPKLLLSLVAVSSPQQLSATETTAALPPILNFYPACEPTTINELKHTRIIQDFDQNEAGSTAAAKAIFLHALQKKAAAQGGDALILNEVKTKLEYAELKKGHSEHRLRVEGSARLIKFCEGNQQLSARSTRWNEHGEVQSTQDQGTTSISFNIVSDNRKAQTEVEVLPTLSKDISLSSGIFGLQPGMSRTQIEQLIGRADAEIQLANGLKALGYGRQTWLIFNDTLQQIQTERRFLSGYGQNLLALHDDFDNNNWLLEGKVSYKMPLAEVRGQLPQASEAGTDQLQLKNQQQQLLLTFDKFNLVHQQPPISMLTGFVLKKSQQKQLTLQVPIVKPELYHTVLQQMQPMQLSQSPLWSALTIPDGLPQHLFRLEKAQWRILGDYVQLQIEDDQVKKLRISDRIFFQPEQASIFNELYQALGLPNQKQQLLNMFSDGELYHQQFNLYRDSFHLQVSFDSDADDAKPEEVILSYFNG